MDLRPSLEQQQLVETFAKLYADHATPAQAAAGTTGFDEDLWRRLVETDVIGMALPEEAGGYGASLLDLALVAEQHGRAVAPAPLIEAQVAARLLARLGSAFDPVHLVEGRRLVTIAVRPAHTGRAELVPAGAVADDALILVDDRIVLAPLKGAAVAVANLGFQPLADLALSGEERVLASGADAVEAFALAVDEWRVLTAAALVGLSLEALQICLEYVKVRRAFGKVVGAFQAVAHKLADRATECEGAQLLAWEAAWAAEAEPHRMPELASMALGFGADTAIATSHDALHFHGGYGFMVEYPIQQYYRRARTWATVLESPAESYRGVGRSTLAAVGLEGGY
jgi:alkylation response protein AidB-like acyl-CoA dehydrogenase